MGLRSNFPTRLIPTIAGIGAESASYSTHLDTQESRTPYSVHQTEGIGQEIKDENGLTVAWTVIPELAHRIVRLLNSE
jgi:hypothetical protein